MRILRVLLPAVLGVPMLTACTPPSQPFAGLTLRDGQPVMAFVACDLSFATVGIYRDDPDPPPSGGPPSGRAPSGRAPSGRAPSWDLHGDPAERVVEFKLWEAPAGRQVDRSDLTELEPAAHYSIGGLSRWHAIQVDFTVADLDRLDAEHVLAGRLGKEPAVVPRADFEKTAEKARRKK